MIDERIDLDKIMQAVLETLFPDHNLHVEFTKQNDIVSASVQDESGCMKMCFADSITHVYGSAKTRDKAIRALLGRINHRQLYLVQTISDINDYKSLVSYKFDPIKSSTVLEFKNLEELSIRCLMAGGWVD